MNMKTRMIVLLFKHEQNDIIHANEESHLTAIYSRALEFINDRSILMWQAKQF